MMEGQSPIFFKHATDAQLDWVTPPAKWGAEEADARLRVMADTNTAPFERRSSRQTRRQSAVKR